MGRKRSDARCSSLLLDPSLGGASVFEYFNRKVSYGICNLSSKEIQCRLILSPNNGGDTVVHVVDASLDLNTGSVDDGQDGLTNLLLAEMETLDKFSLSDVIGCTFLEDESEEKGYGILKVYCYPKKEYGGGIMCPRIAKHREYKVEAEFVPSAKTFVAAVRNIIFRNRAADETRQKKYLVVVNPVSGQKKAEKICKEIVKPMLDQSEISYEIFVTQYGGQLEEWGKNEDWGRRRSDELESEETFPELNIRDYGAVITIGGDGLLAEIFQGVKTRRDRDGIFEDVVFGIVAGGTSNGLAASILYKNKEHFSVLSSTFLICKGNSVSHVDISRYQTISKTYLSFLTFSWGIIADVDLESEVIRCLGILRNDIWAVLRIINLRTYMGRFSYKPPIPKSQPLDVKDPLPKDWITIETEFILFWACQVSHAASNTFNSPKSTLDDGIFRVLVVRKDCPRLELIKMFLKIETGGHIEHDACEVYECSAFRLQPLCEGSFNDLDGEEVEQGVIQGEVIPSAIKMFA